MHSSLFTLLTLHARGAVRRIFRGLKTPKGALFFVFGAAMMILWLGPGLLIGLTSRRTNPEIMLGIVPVVLLAFSVLSIATSAGEKVFYFSPGEVDFLFAGPFTRQELLYYKILKNVSASALMALLFSIAFLQHVTYWIAAFFGVFLSLVVIQFLSMTVILLGQIVAQRAYNATRKILLAVFFVAGGFTLLQLFSSRVPPPAELLRWVSEESPLRWLIVPFIPFGKAIAAPTIVPKLVMWLAVALAIDLALLVLVIRLDVDYMEGALESSQRIYARLQRVSKGGGMMALGTVKVPLLLRLPPFPWLGGAGPIAWRQCTSALRSTRGLLFVFLVLALSFSPVLVVWSIKGGLGNETAGIIVGLLAGLTFYLAMFLPFDFRTELENMEWLKVLPVRPEAIATGELLAPVLVMTFLQLLLLGAVAFAIGPRPTLLAASMFTVPTNFILFGSENLLFLLFPTRLVNAGAGDFQFMGRFMIAMVLKLLIIGASLGITAGVGFLFFFLLGRSWLAFLWPAWIALVSLVVVLVWLVSWAFQRFDVSLDTPS